MTLRTILAATSVAALSAAAPAAAQYASPYGYSPYGYASPYGSQYGYGYNNTAQVAAQQCSAAVQNRLARRSVSGISGILGAVLGANTGSSARVLSVTQVVPRRSSVRVHGLASSGANYGYGPYGAGAYGAMGYSYQPDLSFSCTVDYRGYVTDVDIDRRR